MAGKTLHDILIDLDHDVIVSDTFDPIDAIINAIYDIDETVLINPNMER